MAATFTQFGLASAFLMGLYDDHFTFKRLAEHGDFGHGTFNAIEGEMIAIDGIFYRADVDGNISAVLPDQLTPIATVTHFKPDNIIQLHNITDFTGFKNQIIPYLRKQNTIHAIRIDAMFESILARSEHPQIKPYQNEPIEISMPKLQRSFVLENVQASMMGFFVPDVYKTIVLAGFHFHCINDARTKGGHVFDFKFKRGTVSLQYCTELCVVLPLSAQFDHIDLSQNTDNAFKVAEHGGQ